MVAVKAILRANREYLLCIVLSLAVLCAAAHTTLRDNPFFGGSTSAETYYRARVVEVLDVKEAADDYIGARFEYEETTVSILLLEGAMRGDTVTLTRRVERGVHTRSYPLKRGQKILVSFNFTEHGDVVWYFADFLREGKLMLLGGTFLLLLILFGRKKGVDTVLSVLFTVGAVFFVLLPGIIKGYNIYVLTILVSLYVTVMVLLIISGISLKSLAAGIGCMGGVAVAGLVTLTMQYAMQITGLVSEESAMVMFINPARPIDLVGIVFASSVIGALGATLDTAMSIASALDELLLHRPDLTGGELVASGLSIGRDVLGTMTNTLILAYVGSSLHTVLLLLAYNLTVSGVINREQIAVEVLHALAGSLGLLFATPAATLAAVLLRGKGPWAKAGQ